MESSNLSSTPEPETAWEAQLRASADRALPDAGFSARVLQALPPAAGRAGTLEWRVAGTAGLAGLLWVLGTGGRWTDLLLLLQQALDQLAALTLPVLVAALLGLAAVYLTPEDEVAEE